MWYGSEMPESHKLCVESVRHAYAKHKHTMLEYGDTSGHSPAHFADLERLRLASKFPDMVWIDCDVFVNKTIDIPKGCDKPLMAYHHGRPDIFYFAVNGCCEQFRLAYEKLLTCPEGLTASKYRQWLGKNVSQKIDCIEIPRSDYFHLMAHRWSEVGRMRRIGKFIG